MLKKTLLPVVSIITIILFALVVGSCQSQKPPTTPSESVSSNAVDISNFSFNPASMTVKTGTEVIFTNKDSVRHTVTSDNRDFDSGLLAQGASFKRTFVEPGEYHYHCTPHPNMKGMIIVK